MTEGARPIREGSRLSPGRVGRVLGKLVLEVSQPSFRKVNFQTTCHQVSWQRNRHAQARKIANLLTLIADALSSQLVMKISLLTRRAYFVNEMTVFLSMTGSFIEGEFEVIQLARDMPAGLAEWST